MPGYWHGNRSLSSPESISGCGFHVAAHHSSRGAPSRSRDAAAAFPALAREAMIRMPHPPGGKTDTGGAETPSPGCSMAKFTAMPKTHPIFGFWFKFEKTSLIVVLFGIENIAL